MTELVGDLARLDPKKPLPTEIKKVIEDRMAEAGSRYQSIYRKGAFESLLPFPVEDEIPEKRFSPSNSIMKENEDKRKKERKSTLKVNKRELEPIDLPDILVREETKIHHQQSRVFFLEKEKPLPSIHKPIGILDSRSYLTRATSQRGSTRTSTKDPFYYADRFGSEAKNTPLVIRSKKSILGEMSEVELQAELMELAKTKKESIGIVQRLKTIGDGGKVLPTSQPIMKEDEENEKPLRRSVKHTSLFFHIPQLRTSSVREEEGEEIEEEEEEILEWSPEMETSYLSALEVTAILTQIEIALDELGIIENLLPKELRKDGTSTITVPRRLYESPEERFVSDSLVEDREDEKEEEIESENEARDTLKKLQEVRTFASDVLTDTRKSLKDNNSFWPLFLTVEDQKQMRKDEKKMRRKYSHWDEKFEEKRRSIKNTMEEHEEALAIAEFRHLELMNQLDVQHRTIDAQTRYIERWEKARQEQNRLFLKRLLKRTRKKLSDVNTLIEHESTRYAQVRTMGEEAGKTPEDRILRQMSKWEERRTKDVDKINKNILEEKYKLHAMKKDVKVLEKEYKRRENLILEFNRIRVLREKQVSAAKRIQHWWRLILYKRSASQALAAAKVARRAILKRQRKMRTRLRKGTVLLPPIWPLWGHTKGASSIELKKKMESLPKVPYKPTKAELLRFKAEEKRRKEMEKKRLRTLDYIIETINKQVAEDKMKNLEKVQDGRKDTKDVQGKEVKKDKPEVKKSPKVQKMSLNRNEWTGPLEFGTRESWELIPATIPERSIKNVSSYAERVIPRENRESIKSSGALLKKYKSVVFPPDMRKRQSSLVV